MNSVLRDAREPGFFQMDNAIIDRYASQLGVIGLAVYTLLARRADRAGASHPSYKGMADKLGTSRSSVIRAVNLLLDLGLLEKHTVSPKGERPHNEYRLVNVRAVAPVSESNQSMVSQVHQSHTDTISGVTGTPEMVSQVHPKNTHRRILKEEDSSPRERVKTYPGAPARAHETGASPKKISFSPANPRLTPEELAADAAAVGATPGRYAAIAAQWADSRLAAGGTSADWRADCRKFARSYLEREPSRPGGGARASPEPFATAGMRMTSESLDTVLAARKEFERGRSGVSGGDDGADGRLSARVRADAGGDGGLAETPRRP